MHGTSDQLIGFLGQVDHRTGSACRQFIGSRLSLGFGLSVEYGGKSSVCLRTLGQECRRIHRAPSLAGAPKSANG